MGSVAFCVLLFEGTVRFFVKPSPGCYGVLFQAQLPPFTLRPGDQLFFDYNHPEGLLGLSRGDLWGIEREDPVLGFAPQEETVSLNSWWQSNNLGARAQEDVTKNIPFGQRRVMIFGDSYTNCSRVPLQMTWPFFLNQESKNITFLNFGVDGYSMGQCLLRFEIVRKKIDYDMAILVFDPSEDLWRDINVFRQLNGWFNYPLLPRFVVEHHQLTLVKSPYKDYWDFLRENKDRPSDRFKEHLRAYDRFYFNSKYEAPSFWGSSVLYKLIARSVYLSQSARLWKDMWRPDSEAMTVSLGIFDRFAKDVKQDDRKFVVVLFPTKDDIVNFRNDRSFRDRWNKIFFAIEKKGLICINLMDGFVNMDPGDLDTGLDGGHYGPHTNKTIEKLLWPKLKVLGLM